MACVVAAQNERGERARINLNARVQGGRARSGHFSLTRVRIPLRPFPHPLPLLTTAKQAHNSSETKIGFYQTS